MSWTRKGDSAGTLRKANIFRANQGLREEAFRHEGLSN